MSLLKNPHLPYPTPPPTAPASQDPTCGYYAYGPTGEAYYIWPAYGAEGSGEDGGGERPRRGPPVKTGKRRANNNNKERKRTRSINAAFCMLRSAIPEIPPDTKLSKIKTLKLATSYIVHLMDILEERKSPESFEADIIKVSELTSRKREPSVSSGSSKSKKASGRTGWPQHVWSLELKHENPAQQT